MTRQDEAAIIASPKRAVREIPGSVNGAELRRSFTLKDDHDREYRLFVRRSGAFPENFSVGIDVVLDNEEIPLRRYNGRHGPNEQLSHHESFHSHNPTWREDRRVGRGLRYIVEEHDYATVEEALTVACQRCRIEGMEDFFPHLGQNEFHFES